MSRGRWIAVGAVTVIVIVVLALFVTGVIPGLKSTSSPGATSYHVTFSETGLPSGTSWSVTLAGSAQSSSTASVVFSEKNGAYSFTVGAVSGYTANPASGNVTVSGADVTETIAFTSGGAASYAVAFTESGLTSGTSWSVTLAGSTQSSTTSTITFTEVNGTYVYTVSSVSGYTANPVSGSVTVAGAAKSVSITFTALAAGEYTVTFTESGLAGGTSWSVTLGGTTHSSSTTSIGFTETNGTYAFTVGTVTGYTADPASGSVTVAGAAKSVSITFTALASGEYTVTFTESGLPSGTSWSVTFAGSTESSAATTIAFTKANGTYTYTVGSVTGYTANPSSGQVTVAGAAMPVAITFTKSSGLGGPAHAVTWAQTGLPSKDLWMVSCVITTKSFYVFGARNTGPSTEFAIPDGTYAWYVGTNVPGYVASPEFGNVSVAGAPVTISIKFLRTYTVNFTESGLSSGAEWNVSFGGKASSAFAPSDNAFEVTNGTYSFTATAFGYTASPATGTVTVNGADVAKAITFTALPAFDVTFAETGLAASTLWQVTLNGNTRYAVSGSTIVFHYPNGKYPFDVTAPGSVAGYYSASPASGTITVAGATQMKAITFTALPTYMVKFTETGLPSTTTWYVLLNGSVGSASAPADISIKAPTGKNTFLVFASGYTASPALGNVTVTTSGATVTITFTSSAHGLHKITFVETGLPSTDWQVSLRTDQFVFSANYYCSNTTSSSTQLVCSVADGYYTWIVQTSVSDYTGNPMAGALTVSGHDATVNVAFQNTAGQYLVWFDAQTYSFFSGGLPNGTIWSVTLNGKTQTTQGTALGFLVPTGTTAAYTIAPPAGYVVLPSAGNLTGYANPSQSTDYETVSPGVILAFGQSSGGARPANVSGTSPATAFYASLVMAFREL